MIGIVKTQLTPSDHDFFLINNLNQLAQTTTSSCLFCDEIANSWQSSTMQTTLLHRAHAFSFDGILITDELLRCQDFHNIPIAKKRFLYLYHLSWPQIPSLQFKHIKHMLLNKNIGLIARSTSHAKLIERLFKKPDYIMPEWNYKTLIEIDNHE
jgi:hypothetical protein